METQRIYCTHCQRFKLHSQFALKPEDGTTLYNTCESCRTKLSKRTSWLKQPYICECGKTMTHHSKSKHLAKSCPLRENADLTGKYLCDCGTVTKHCNKAKHLAKSCPLRKRNEALDLAKHTIAG